MLNIRKDLEILLNIFRQNNIQNSISFAKYLFSFQLTNKIDSNIIVLIKKLNGLSLILTIASIYLEQISISFLDYLYLYKVS